MVTIIGRAALQQIVNGGQAVAGLGRSRGTQAAAIRENSHARQDRIPRDHQVPLAEGLLDDLMLTARDLMARAGELVGAPDVPGSGVRLEGIQAQDDGTAFISFRRFKTSTESTTLLVGADTAEALKVWTDYLRQVGIMTGPVFIALTKGGKPTGAPLAAGDVNRIVKALAKRIGLEGFSGHSMRVGAAVDFVRGKLTGAGIMLRAGWKTQTMLVRYTRTAAQEGDEFAEHFARRHK
jgi:hypothetical protein